MKDETRKKLEEIAQRYSKYGVTLMECISIYNSGVEFGISEESAVIGLRLALSNKFNEHEYFTSADVATITGETVEEVNQRIEENKEELMNNGSVVEVSSPIPDLFN
ncbi:MAG: hypothetical protein K2O29_04170 [Ruminococcus sp.]|nr:hypothetical protein [Ruminococcus sp.]MDE7137638.1 hypothetical protein [Ruminococcus sp.]